MNSSPQVSAASDAANTASQRREASSRPSASTRRVQASARAGESALANHSVNRFSLRTSTSTPTVTQYDDVGKRRMRGGDVSSATLTTQSRCDSARRMYDRSRWTRSSTPIPSFIPRTAHRRPTFANTSGMIVPAQRHYPTRSEIRRAAVPDHPDLRRHQSDPAHSHRQTRHGLRVSANS